ncbi:MAG: motility protein A [Campylobacterales bacterium]
MDLGTVVGLIAVFGLLAGAMTLGVGVGPYIDVISLLIVVGGSISALFIAFKIEQMKNFGKLFMIAIKPPKYDIPDLIKKLVEYATQARRDGILSLEQAANAEENDFLRKGLSMAVDGNEPDTIRELLEVDMEQTANRHRGNAAIFDQWAAIAGAFGMIGTLIGLVAMLLNMADPSAIGPAMAVALITTFYGAVIGNTLGAPIANILGIRAADEELVKTLILEGIMSIQAGDNPRTLEAKLLSFLPPKERVSQFE